MSAADIVDVVTALRRIAEALETQPERALPTPDAIGPYAAQVNPGYPAYLLQRAERAERDRGGWQQQTIAARQSALDAWQRVEATAIERDAARAEVARLSEALERLRDGADVLYSTDVRSIAIRALGGTP